MRIKMIKTVVGSETNGKPWSVEAGTTTGRFSDEEVMRMVSAGVCIPYSNEKVETTRVVSPEALETRTRRANKVKSTTPKTRRNG